MKTYIISVLVGLCCAASALVAVAQQHAPDREDAAIKAIVIHAWFDAGQPPARPPFKAPYMALSVNPTYRKGGRILVRRDQNDMDKYVKEVSEVSQENVRLEKAAPTIGGPEPIVPVQPQLSPMAITKPSADVAYVSYSVSFKPNPHKRPPLPLLAVLLKERGKWRIVFAMTP